MKGRGLKAVLGLFFLILAILPNAISVQAAAGPTIITTLSEHAVQRGSKKTFEVWAKNAAGEKIKATVKLNGAKVEPTWDDSEKTSYTLQFTQEGEYTVTVAASSDGGKRKELTYHITYRKANPGDKIGTATWSVEMFTIGCGYLIAPVEMPIYEGETSAEQLLRLLHANGFAGYYGGTVNASFYLAYIADGSAAGAKYNNYQKSGTPTNPQRLNLSPCIPDVLIPHLRATMTFYDPDDYKNNWNGYLGEFAFTNGSGWMYSVNNVFPNVGFADYYLSDGDVVRVQYTLGYGADIGGFGSVGAAIPEVDNQPTAGYYAVANKDTLSKEIGRARASGLMERSNVKKAYAAAVSVMEMLNAGQDAVDSAACMLEQALQNPEPEAGSGSGGSPDEREAQGSAGDMTSTEDTQITPSTESDTAASSTTEEGASNSEEASEEIGNESGGEKAESTAAENEGNGNYSETTKAERENSAESSLPAAEQESVRGGRHGILWMGLSLLAVAAAVTAAVLYRGKKRTGDQ